MSLYEHGSHVGPCSFEVEDMTSFTITDVGNLLGIERLSGGDDASYNVVCPFCGDRRGSVTLLYTKMANWQTSIIDSIVMRQEICLHYM